MGGALIRWAAVVLLGMQPVVAQRLYEQALDEQARQAARAAGAFSSASLFEKQLRNLEALATRDLAVWFGDARNLMRARIGNWRTWRQVDRFVEGLKSQAPPADLKARRAELEERRTAAEQAFRGVSEWARAAGDLPLLRLAERLGRHGAVYELGKRLLESSAPEAAGEAVRALTQLELLYRDTRQRLERIRELDQQLAGLRVPLERIQLELLEVEEQHLAEVAAIRARAAREAAQARELAEEYAALRRNLRVADGEEGLEVVLQRLAAAGDRGGLERALRALLVAAALAGRGAAPAELAQLREAQQQQRYSIRRSAVAARAYEAALGRGTQLLALYYQGGLRPGQIAEMVFRLTGIATLPVIAAR